MRSILGCYNTGKSQSTALAPAQLLGLAVSYNMAEAMFMNSQPHILFELVLIHSRVWNRKKKKECGTLVS
jgi:hypothetical protein